MIKLYEIPVTDHYMTITVPDGSKVLDVITQPPSLAYIAVQEGSSTGFERRLTLDFLKESDSVAGNQNYIGSFSVIRRHEFIMRFVFWRRL